MNANAPKPPEKVFRAGRARASIWKDEVDDDGQTIIRWNIKIEKTYQDRETKEHKTTNYFYASELADLELVTRKAREYVRVREFDGAAHNPTADAEETAPATEDAPF